MTLLRRLLATIRAWLLPTCHCADQTDHDAGCPWSDPGVGT